VAVVVEEAAAAVEFDGRVAVGDFEVKEFGVVLAGGCLGQVKQLCANSLSAKRSFDEEFVNPCALASIFQAAVETDHQAADWRRFFTDNVDNAVDRVLKKLGEIRAEGRLIERLCPWIIRLHVAHHSEKSFEIGGGGLGDGDRHEMRNPLE